MHWCNCWNGLIWHFLAHVLQEFHYHPRGSDTCLPCDCYPVGSFSRSCDAETGQCQCRPGVIGRQCNACDNPFAEVTNSGCEGERLFTIRILYLYVVMSHVNFFSYLCPISWYSVLSIPAAAQLILSYCMESAKGFRKSRYFPILMFNASIIR